LQLIVGLVWVLGLIWMFLALAAIAEPISAVAVLTYWGGLLFSPILLFVSSLAMFRATRHRLLAGTFAVIGSLAVLVQALVWVGPSMVASLRGEDNRLAALLAGIVAMSVVSSLAAFMLYRDLRTSDESTSVV
jgi:uncharacterized membrane protein